MTDQSDDVENGQSNARCTECQRELSLGEDCIQIQGGVIGPRGFVPVEEPTYLCDHVCARDYFGPEEEGTGRDTSCTEQ